MKRNLILGILRGVNKYFVHTPTSYEEEMIMAGVAAIGVYQTSRGQGILTCIFRAVLRALMKI